MNRRVRWLGEAWWSLVGAAAYLRACWAEGRQAEAASWSEPVDITPRAVREAAAHAWQGCDLPQTDAEIAATATALAEECWGRAT